jgi:hypothetical protein
VEECLIGIEETREFVEAASEDSGHTEYVGLRLGISESYRPS